MNELPNWLFRLDMMSQTQIDIMQFFLSACIIATLAVLILSQPQEATLWKIALTICIVLTTIGMIVAFTPAPYAKYAPLFRNWGVLLMLLIALVLRFRKTEGWTLVRIGKYNLVIYAFMGVVVSGLVAMPFFTVVTSQEKVETKQNSIFGLIFIVLDEIRGLRSDLKRDHDERINQHRRDSTERAGINQVVSAIRVDIRKGLVNGWDAKSTPKRAAKSPSNQMYFILPAPKPFPVTNFSLPADRVKSPDPKLDKSPKPRKGKNQAVLDPEADPLARAGEWEEY